MKNLFQTEYCIAAIHSLAALHAGGRILHQRQAAEYIERLSRYMASNDRHYANHYATIKKWLDEDSKGRSAKNYTYDDNEGECL